MRVLLYTGVLELGIGAGHVFDWIRKRDSWTFLVRNETWILTSVSIKQYGSRVTASLKASYSSQSSKWTAKQRHLMTTLIMYVFPNIMKLDPPCVFATCSG